MSSVNNSGISDLTQFLVGSSSPLLSAGLSSSQIKSIVQNASPADLVQLSNQALQLQNVSELFGDTGQSQAADNTDSLQYGALPAAGEVSASSTQTSPLVSHAASTQTQLQTEEMQTLFGISSTTNTSASPLNFVV